MIEYCKTYPLSRLLGWFVFDLPHYWKWKRYFEDMGIIPLVWGYNPRVPEVLGYTGNSISQTGYWDLINHSVPRWNYQSVKCIKHSFKKEYESSGTQLRVSRWCTSIALCHNCLDHRFTQQARWSCPKESRASGPKPLPMPCRRRSERYLLLWGGFLATSSMPPPCHGFVSMVVGFPPSQPHPRCRRRHWVSESNPL